MTTIVMPCLSCRHYHGFQKCDAYPERIPDKILAWKHDHREPYPGDHGIRYEPIKEEPKRG